MEKLLLKYRTWYQGEAPRPIKLEIPGWAGEFNSHKDGDKPQPWHCIPFVEGSTYGLELCYPFDTECCVEMRNGEIYFDGDFTQENINNHKEGTHKFGLWSKELADFDDYYRLKRCY